MWVTIAYKQVLENNTVVRLYDDSTEKHFVEYNDAAEYGAYLMSNNISLGVNTNIDVYEKTIYTAGELDINQLKINDALNKLTQEEKDLLGL
jgi:hypothetical protein